MTVTRGLVVRNQRDSDDDMFHDIEPVSALEIKKTEVATHLAALMSYKGKTRSGLATELGWNKSRMTKVLSGRENLTIKTIWEFSSQLGLDFSVLFQELDLPKPKQPWQIKKSENTTLPVNGMKTIVAPLEVQSAQEVAADFICGNQKEYYFSFNMGAYEETFYPEVTNNMQELIAGNAGRVGLDRSNLFSTFDVMSRYSTGE